ncbi:MAG: Mrp/NBP35 family ATP-binding protein [Elusimicrobia bacterium]|nr:Mrp/NBP35 family ATP-binding protein [Elusimicrobiota bacterium]
MHEGCHGKEGSGRKTAAVSLPGIRNILAVGSGKGGVGKSTAAANIAVSLALDGAKVGLLDADIYGPNLPQMMGIGKYSPKAGPDNKLEPPVGFGVKVISMGFFVDSDSPVIWRGPMVHGAIVQLLSEVSWGELDYLVVDLPPGTGDAQLSLCQSVPVSGAVLVSTPQSVALSDVRKALSMFKSLQVPVLGLVENMAEFACPHCGKTSRVFSHGGAKELAEKHGIPLLGSVPLDPLVCETGESGAPVAASQPGSAAAKAFREIAAKVVERLSTAASRRGTQDF